MATCLLVYVPSVPMQVEDLMPQEELALAAGYLRQAGHTARILDLATPMDTPSHTDVRGLRWLRGRLHTDERRVDSLVARINDVIYSLTGGLDLVAFLVRNREGLMVSTKVSNALQSRTEPPRTVCFGPYAERFAPYISAYNPAFDTVIAEETGTVLSCMMDSPDLGWGGVPGLMVRERGGSIYTGRVKRANHTAPRPLPDYSPGVYPQVHSGEKLRYFPIRHSALRNAITPSLMARARHVRTQFGGVPLHFEYGAAQAAQIEALSRGIANLGLGGSCSLAAPVAAIAAVAPESLQRLRCTALTLDILTGSQRLLDEFFHAGFTVTEIETAMRTARAGGAAVHAAFTYPCPWDDHHTEAETLRILERNRPSGVTARLPELVPGSPWYADPDRYGFRLRHRRLARFAAAAESGAEPRPEGNLLEQLTGLGMPLGVGAQGLLCAKLSGTIAHAGALAAEIQDRVSTGGAQTARVAMALINDHISDEASSVAPHSDRHVRAAMGN